MTPLGWGWAVFVWGYTLAWFFLNDRVKPLAYRIFHPTEVPLLVKNRPPRAQPTARRATTRAGSCR